jgi:PAS domain S-box-containing protein
MRSSDELSLIAAIAEDLPVGVWVASVPDGLCVYANEAFEAILGAKAVPGVIVEHFSHSYAIHTRDGAPYPEAQLPFYRAWSARATVVVDDMVAHGRGGARSFLRAFGKPMFDDAGEITHVAVVLFDISREIEAQSARARAEAEHSEIRARLTRVLDHAPLVLFAFDQEGVVTLCEGQGLERIGLRPSDFLGRCMFTIYPADPIVAESARRALAGETLTYSVEMNLAASGTYETRLAPIRDDAANVVGGLGVATDVSDRVRMEAQLARAERLASVGLLAAGVAHEVNNPLAYVIGNLDLIAARIESAAPGALDGSRAEIGEMLRDAREGAQRVRAIVRDLKVFSGERERKRTAVDVRAALEGAIRIASNEIRHRARLSLEILSLPAVLGDEGRLGQLFLNLLLNAAQAIPEGASERNEIRVAARTTGPGEHGGRDTWACIEISDTGVGMSRAVLAKIFEPFFTTKPVGSGTGLGLSICHAIAADLGGRIEVESQPGQGSTFRVWLPRASADVLEPLAKAEALPVDRRRSSVLVVDDEPQIVKLLALLLDPFHDVTSEQRADAALQRIARGERFDVILCDVMMPQMTGMDLHDTLRTVAPDQADAMLFLTGGAFTARAREFLGRLPEAVIEKPVDPAALLARVARMAQKRR